MRKLKLKPLNQQVVVLIGASSGIGRLASLFFAEKGAKLVVVSRHEPGLQSLVDEIKLKGGDAIYVVADVSFYNEVENVATEAIEAYGRIDTWINNASVLIHALCEDILPEEYKRLIEVNYLGQVYGTLVALKHMKRNGGSIIQTTSVAANVHPPYIGAYTAAKHAVQGFMDTLRIELRKEGAPINLVNLQPTTINTPLFNKGRSKLGVRGRASPPVYKPDVVAQTMLYAATHIIKRDLACGTAAKAYMTLKRLFPRVYDRLLLAKGFEGMRTNSPKVPAENNIWEPLETSDYEKVYGDMSDEEQWSALDWYRTSRRVKVFIWLSAASFTSANVAIATTLLQK